MMLEQLPNFLDNNDIGEIEDFLQSINFAWFYNKNIGGETSKEFYINDLNIKDTDGFVHMFVDDNQPNSPHVEIINLIIDKIQQHFNKPVKTVLRARASMIKENPGFGNYYQIPHVDYTIPHYTAIYYVNDADGDTIFFNEYYTTENTFKKTIQHRVSPERGKCIVFNGLQYHTGSVPTKNKRIIININFTLEEIL
tara:strand:+ start:1967 stop:2554 length:588 start_codon:yes stop_codon:yes gene_type:complete